MHGDLRIRCFLNFLQVFEVDFAALKFQGICEFSSMHFRDWKSRIIHHNTVRIRSTCVMRESTTTVKE